MRTVLGLFLIAHGLVTMAIWGPRYPAAPEGQLQPPDPAHSWLFGDIRTFSLLFGIIVSLALVAAGVGFLMDQTWWPPMAIAAGVGSLLLFGVFFTPWWAAGIAISGSLVLGVLRATPVG